MNRRTQILYDYFINRGRVHKIQRTKKHKDRLLSAIRKRYPGFMHPYAYAFGMVGKQEGEDVKYLINFFENYRVKGLRKLKLKVFGK